MRKAISNALSNVSPAAYVVLAFSILFLPFRWVIAWLAATLFHEFCHYAALRACSCSMDKIYFGLNGAVMEADSMEWTQQLLCILAGPIGSLLLLLFGKWFPEVAICAFVQSLYNLLPVMPMDGGRVISCILHQLFSDETAQRLQINIELSTLIVLAAACLYASVHLHLGIIPVIAFILLYLKNRKTPCKAVVLRVQ